MIRQPANFSIIFRASIPQSSLSGQPPNLLILDSPYSDLPEVSMTISEQAYTEITQFIQEEECLNAHNLEAFFSWVEPSYEALEVDPVQQERFDKYCRSSCD